MLSEIEGHLFDIYHVEDMIYLWILDGEGRSHCVSDQFFPVIYAHGPEVWIEKLNARLMERGVLKERPWRTRKIHFYDNRPIEVTAYRFLKPSFLRRIHRKLFALFDKIDLYHSDIEIPAHYMYEKGLYPLARLRVTIGPVLSPDPALPGVVPEAVADTPTESARAPLPPLSGPGRLVDFELLEKRTDLSYSLPEFRILKIYMKNSHRSPISLENPLVLELPEEKIEINSFDEKLLLRLNQVLADFDPDVILSAYGDQILFPNIFRLAQNLNLPLFLDRDRTHTLRKVVTKGTSYMTYGSIVFRAPSYPLFGRWHVDSCNSFVFKESQLEGLIELSRLSLLPLQRLARSSTGTAMTVMQTNAAIEREYLVPWQKSHIEEKKTALELLTIDKGGIVYEPDIRKAACFENVAQIDFSQMYPSIMVNHNISPETVLCDCCEKEESAQRVPEAGYHICVRRRGIVPISLEHLLDRRRYYKKIKKESGDIQQKERADARQNSLKWLLVTSFGYLGYRNAKFGRLESHESVTAFGREILLRAKEISEEGGWELLHAITDCLFIRHTPNVTTEIPELLQLIYADTGVEIQSEGVFSWLVFLPSRADPNVPVANRYFGRYENGVLKYRGIMARRKDTPRFMQECQLGFLSIMQKASSAENLRALHGEMDDLYRSCRAKLESQSVPWQDLLLRRTVSKEMNSYTAQGPTLLSLQQLASSGIAIQAGEKVRYLIVDRKNPISAKRYLAEETALKTPPSRYDVSEYIRILREAYREVWEAFAPPRYFDFLHDGQMRLAFNNK